MYNEIVVRRASIADWPAIREFLFAAYAELATYKDRPRWEWQFCNNPYLVEAVEDVKEVPVWIAVDNGRVVGQIAVQIGQLALNGQEHKAGWIVDVMVLPEYRGRQLGHKIHAKCAESESLLVTLTMAPATRRIAEKAGCINLKPVKQFTRLVRPDSKDALCYVLNRTKTRAKLHQAALILTKYGQFHVIGSGVVRFCTSWRKGSSQPKSTGVVIKEAPEFNSEFDRLWERVKGDYEAIFSRDSKFLTWRFDNVPDMSYRKFLAYRNDVAVGYVILRHAESNEPRVGIIVDIVAGRGDLVAVESLIEFGISHFGDSVAGIDCVTSIPEFEKCLRRAGFWPTRTVYPTCVCEDKDLAAKLSDSDWFFSKADHDWDQIHLAWNSANSEVAR